MPNDCIIVTAFLGAYLYIDYLERENMRLSRKNPADYENDV